MRLSLSSHAFHHASHRVESEAHGTCIDFCGFVSPPSPFLTSNFPCIISIVLFSLSPTPKHPPSAQPEDIDDRNVQTRNRNRRLGPPHRNRFVYTNTIDYRHRPPQPLDDTQSSHYNHRISLQEHRCRSIVAAASLQQQKSESLRFGSNACNLVITPRSERTGSSTSLDCGELRPATVDTNTSTNTNTTTDTTPNFWFSRAPSNVCRSQQRSILGHSRRRHTRLRVRLHPTVLAHPKPDSEPIIEKPVHRRRSIIHCCQTGRARATGEQVTSRRAVATRRS